jgi:ABC-type Na+ transport system ATPase subunit NatA
MLRRMLSAATPLTKSLTICRVRSSRSHRPRRLCQAAYSVVFDEPTSALSVRETEAVLKHIKELRAENYPACS